MTAEHRPAAERREHDTRSGFDRFVELAQSATSGSRTFGVVLIVIVLWALSFPLFHHAAEWQAMIHTIAAIVTLLLLVLLENASKRADEASQEKINVLSDAVAALLDDQAGRAGADPELDLAGHADRLRTAVGLETRH